MTGNDGVESFNFASGTSSSNIVAAINQAKEATGVSAALRSADPNSGIVFYSIGWGSKSFVKVQGLNGKTFDTVDSGGVTTKEKAFGRDVAAAINGSYTVGDGLNVSLNTTYLSMDLTFDPSFGANSTSFNITGGGALFQLGPHVSINEQRSFGIQSCTATNLGNNSVGYLSQVVTSGDYCLVGGDDNQVRTKTAQAAKIVDTAITQIASLRGRLGAFEKNTLDTNVNSLQVALENVTASESSIRDADFAAETSALTRSQILTSAATSVLAIANATPQSVLKLLQ